MHDKFLLHSKDKLVTVTAQKAGMELWNYTVAIKMADGDTMQLNYQKKLQLLGAHVEALFSIDYWNEDAQNLLRDLRNVVVLPVFLRQATA